MPPAIARYELLRTPSARSFENSALTNCGAQLALGSDLKYLVLPRDGSPTQVFGVGTSDRHGSGAILVPPHHRRFRMDICALPGRPGSEAFLLPVPHRTTTNVKVGTICVALYLTPVDT